MALSDQLTQLTNAISSVGTATANKNHTIEQSVTSEATTRGNADTTLQQNITNEVQRAEKEEDALQLLINGLAGLKVGRFVGSAAELAQEQASAPSQATVFNSWYRFSHNASGTFPAVAAETTSWAYNSSTNQIYDTLNSTTAIGVVSNESYADYLLDVSIRSTDSDDDLIGIVLAWYKDPTTGQEYTLSATRTPGGLGPLWGVVYNLNQGATYGQKTVADGSATVNWGNGASGTLSAANSGYVTNTSTTGWSGQATQYGTDGHTRIVAQRTGNTITVKTSLFSAPDTILSSTLLTIDLTADPLLTKFMGSAPYGFVADSQANSYWTVNQFTNTQDTIFDMSTGLAWQNVGGTWSQTTNITWASLGTNVFLVNPDTGKTFFVKDQNNVVQFRTPSLISGGTVNPTDVEAPGNWRGVGIVQATGTLSGDYWGTIYATSTSIAAAITTTLDVSNVLEKAPKIAFLNNCAYPWTIQLSNGGYVNSGQSAGTAIKTLVLAPGMYAEGWYSPGGSALWITGGAYTMGTNGPGNWRGLYGINSTAQALPADPWGYMFQTAPIGNVTANMTTPLPAASPINNGKRMFFNNTSSTYSWTLTATSINSAQGRGLGTLVIGPNSSAEIVHDGSSYFVVDGPYAQGGLGAGNNRGWVLLTTAAPNLPSDPWGYMYEFTTTNTGAVTSALPALNTNTAGKKLKFINISNYACTLTGNVNCTQGHPSTSLVMAPWSVVELDNDGTSYTCTGGTYALSTEGYITINSAAPSGGSNGDTWYQT
jgi:hypothetical protein